MRFADLFAQTAGKMNSVVVNSLLVGLLIDIVLLLG